MRVEDMWRVGVMVGREHSIVTGRLGCGWPLSLHCSQTAQHTHHVVLLYWVALHCKVVVPGFEGLVLM